MQLTIGMSYIDGRGVEVLIAGPTRDYPDLVYSRAGDWYLKSSGEYIGYGKHEGEWQHYTLHPKSPRNLVRVVR